jgi:hypothetical protein
MNLLSQKILSLLASDQGALAEAGRKARSIVFDVRAPRSSTYKALRQLVDEGLVANWRSNPGAALRYRVTATGRVLPVAAALALAILWCAQGTYGYLRPVTGATAALVRQAKGAVSKANPVGEVRQGLTDYQAGLEAERDRWLAPLEEIS